MSSSAARKPPACRVNVMSETQTQKLKNLALRKPERYTAERVIAALVKTKGMITLAARELNCSGETIRNYAKRYPSVAAALHEERERMTDVAELALYKAIQDGEGWAISLYLKTQGKGRGYVERHELDARITNYVVDIDASSDPNIIDADTAP